MSKKLLSLYGLKWNPFHQDLPVEAVNVTERLDRFAWKLEELANDGGFAIITGEVGTGKSVALRYVEHRLSKTRDLHVATLCRPQSSVADFYRELGESFGAAITASNRWGGFKQLRERWRNKLETSLRRPVLLVDEAQEMLPDVLSELRILSSDQLDSQSLLTVVLCGDQRLSEKLRRDDLLPLGSRLRVRLDLGPLETSEAVAALQHALAEAGNPRLMSKELIQTLADHSMGNWRALMNMASEVLLAGMAADRSELDEKLFLELFGDRVARNRKSRGRARQPST